MAIFYQTDTVSSFSPDEYTSAIHHECQTAIGRFKGIIRSYLLFHLSFAILFPLQLILFSYLVLHAPKSLYLALSIATFLLSIFSYCILIYYFQGKKRRAISRDPKTVFFDPQTADAD